ncbi:PLP-dependent transferase [Crassisporium funariophilum]|nr:PLP-dependent transferase [Crassisporium funariophilum]
MPQPPQPRKLLAIPGPIELSPSVLAALSLPPLSHVSPEFVKIFQESLHMTRQVARTKTATPFILAGSGTLGWDQVGANLVERGDGALVLHTGYFGSGFAECLETYGATVTSLHAPLGHTVRLSEVESALRKANAAGKPFKLVTITHVDTSTGVLSDARAIAECVGRVSKGTLVVLDAVCSLASEDVQMDAWGLDVVFSASQKGLGAPPGLSILLASQRAMRVWEGRVKRGVKSGSFYSSWEKWAPIMRAYDEGRPAYFGTPAVTLVRAYHASLLEITRSTTSLTHRLHLHTLASQRIKSAAERLGLTQVAREPLGRANGMTALYIPAEVGTAADVLKRVGGRGVVMAGGLVAEIKDRYIRIGHMGWSVVGDGGDGGRDVDLIVRVLEEAVGEAREAVSGRVAARL